VAGLADLFFPGGSGMFGGGKMQRRIRSTPYQI
jgi:hypothetical protein